MKYEVEIDEPLVVSFEFDADDEEEAVSLARQSLIEWAGTVKLEVVIPL